jgi:hypothetical protein
MEHFRASSVMKQVDQSMRPRFFEQNDQEQLKEDLLTEIKKNGMTLSVEQAMEKMKAQEEEYHRQRYMQ